MHVPPVMKLQYPNRNWCGPHLVWIPLHVSRGYDVLRRWSPSTRKCKFQLFQLSDKRLTRPADSLHRRFNPHHRSPKDILLLRAEKQTTGDPMFLWRDLIGVF
jgi:hypothetical protein